MKKLFLSSGIFAVVLALVSCQKEISENNDGSAVPTITRTVTVEGNDWSGNPASKSVYEPGVGIKLTGEEPLAVYYANPDNQGSQDKSNPYMRPATSVVNNGNGSYTVSHETISVDGKEIAAYDYYFVMPNSKVLGTNSVGTSNTFKLSPVQLPSATSFDSNYDILVGKPQLGVSQSDELSVTEFKRMTTPLKLTVTDEAGVLGTEKIRSVTMKFSASASLETSMTGLLYFQSFADYDKCTWSGKGALGNAVTAVYPDGLAAQDGSWPIWYMVKPATIPSGELTVTVTTDSKTLTRTVSLNSPMNIDANKLNKLSFNISGNGYVASNTLYQDFTSVPEGTVPSALTASDGKAYAWGFSNCLVNYDDLTGLLPNGLRMNGTNASITLPSVLGKQISKIRLYSHVQNQNNNNTVSLNGTAASVNFAFNEDASGLIANGGVAEITVPEAEYGNDLVLTTTASWTALTSVALELAEGEMPEYDPNDYYDMFEKGLDIEINGVKYSKAQYTSRCIPVNDLTAEEFRKDVKTAGILFIDNSGQTEAKSLLEGSNNLALANPVVIIGGYKNSQPEIVAGNQIQARNSIVFKNLNITSTNKTNKITTGNATEIPSLCFEDCTFDLGDLSKGLIYDNHTEKTISSLSIINCVVNMGTSESSTAIYFTDAKAEYNITDVIVKNNVFYAANAKNARIIELGTKSLSSVTDKANVVVENNSMYNLYFVNTVVKAHTVSAMSVRNNVCYYPECAKKSYLAGIFDPEFSNDRISVTGNWLYTQRNAENTNYWGLRNGGSFEGTDNTLGNVEVGGEAIVPFKTAEIDLSVGYVPVDGTVVTNGAGADYETKYWITKQ